ncbi:MAG TPA: UDP-glucose 4-epimerase GalE [Candidatus Sulfotelmatobacter sp.]|jgi:UDP-arabinose 4-epimerase|nr:UDP-glucose 4-epimerase GalE [Candidatus Sulfotelmatobacter sp.]
MKVVIVTGGAGYIGSHTCKALSESGFLPVVVDNMSSGHEWAVQWGPLERGDIRDSAFLDSVFQRWAPHAVVHFAGLIQVGESVSKPDIYYDNNVVGTLELLGAMRRNAVKRIVFSSTCAIFGLPETSPLDEHLPKNPINPYGASKAMVEQLLADHAKAFGLHAAALRYFNASGADPSGRIGEAHEPESHLIPIAIEVAQKRRAALQIYGDDYPTPDGTCVRDYIHVSDLAQAHLRALDWLESHSGFHAFNLGNGKGYSVNEVVKAVERVSGCEVPVIMSKRRDGDSPALVANSRQAQEILGWTPRIASLDDIVASAWNWHQQEKPPVAAPTANIRRMASATY